MAIKPVKLYGPSGRLLRTGASNVMIRAASQTNDRKTVPLLDRDFKRNISGLGRRTMMSIGRKLYHNFSEVRGLVREIVNLTTAVFKPQFSTQDPDWNNEAEMFLANHDKIANFKAGSSPSMQRLRRTLLRNVIVDGDAFVALISAPESDYPFLQVIPPHRISSYDYDSTEVKDGPFKGMTISDGIVMDEYGRAIAYRVWDDNKSDYQILPADSVIHIFDQEWDDQARGYSQLASCLFDFSDVSESRQFELMAQKIAASINLVEYNELGEAENAPFLTEGAEEGEDVSGTPTGLITETIDNHIKYMRSGTGAKLQAYISDRPTQNQRDFVDTIIRACFYGMGWSFDYSLDSTKIGGASMRVQVDKVNRTIASYQDNLIEPTQRRIDSWRIAKGIKLGLVQPNDEWWKFRYQKAARLTADAKYESQKDLEEFSAGVTSLEKLAANRGGDWVELQDQLLTEEMRWNQRRKELGLPPAPFRQTKSAGATLPEQDQKNGAKKNEPDDDEE